MIFQLESLSHTHSPESQSASYYSSSFEMVSGSTGTPRKRRAGNSQGETVSTYRGLLKSDVERYLHSDIDLIEFAVHVWGIDMDTAQAIQGHKWTLDEQSLNTFKEACASGPESALHKPFRDIADKLLTSVLQFLESTSELTDEIWDKLGKSVIAGSPRNLKPDMLNFFKPAPLGDATWHAVKDIREFKLIKGSKGPTTALPAILEDVEAVPQADLPPTLPNSSVAQQQRTRSSGDSSATSLKRKTAEGSAFPSGKRQKTMVMVHPHLQVASYAAESLGSTSRYYVICILIESFDVTVFYFDRTLVLRVLKFDFSQNAGNLALVIYGANICDRLRSGFDPHLHAKPGVRESRLEKPVDHIVGAYLEFERPSVKKGSTPDLISFKILDSIRTPDDLVGRATAVYEVQKWTDAGEEISPRYALKMSWPLALRVSEIDAIQGLLNTLPPSLHRHLPTLNFTASFSAQDMNLPWAKMKLNLTDDNHQERAHRIIVSRFCNKLWEAESIEDFQQAWLDCVECHYHAWQTGRVLHRDLSENNLMLYKDENEATCGVLNDWDMASQIDDEGEVQTTAAHHRTGTPPFMAVDLLTPQTPTHWYRHDLESLFYILVWAAVQYDLKKKRRRSKVDNTLRAWTDTMEINHQHKASFLSDSTVSEQVFAKIQPEFASVLKEWIRPLLRLFRLARLSLLGAREDPDEDNPYDEVTCNGKVTFETFMKAIKRTPRKWNAIKVEAAS